MCCMFCDPCKMQIYNPTILPLNLNIQEKSLHCIRVKETCFTLEQKTVQDELQYLNISTCSSSFFLSASLQTKHIPLKKPQQITSSVISLPVLPQRRPILLRRAGKRILSPLYPGLDSSQASGLHIYARSSELQFQDRSSQPSLSDLSAQ